MSILTDFDISGYPELPKVAGLFITATDTGVGKTLVSGAIAKSLRSRGINVEVFKPVASGCQRSGGELISPDAAFLAACCESNRTLDEINPVRFALPLAPNVAAQREGKQVDLDAIFAQYNRLAEEADIVIVEGVGGLLCPLSDDFWVIHLARMMNLPLVVVARAGLGTINHTLLTLHAARCAGLAVAGVVINGYPVEGEQQLGRLLGADVNALPQSIDDISIMTNPTQIASRGNVEILAIVPQEASNSIEYATLGPDTQFAIDQVPWEKLARC